MPASRTRALARIAAVLTLGCAAAALGGACNSDAFTVQPATDGGEDEGSVRPGDCPKAEPPNGTECLLPEGTTCDFGQCGTKLATCTRGAWKVATNAPPRPPCPMVPPMTDVNCPGCWPAAISCIYGSTDCSADDASVNTAIASCPQGRWVLDIRPCRDGGGPDVQGDGGPDAD